MITGRSGISKPIGTTRYKVRPNRYHPELEGQIVFVVTILPTSIAYIRLPGRDHKDAIPIECLIPQEHDAQEPCYCCGNRPTDAYQYGYSVWALCVACREAVFAWEQGKRIGEGYLYLDCPIHRAQNMAQAKYPLALALFNEKWGTKRRGPNTKWGVDWIAALQTLRDDWAKLAKVNNGQADEGPAQDQLL